jgi:hypothetical protein
MMLCKDSRANKFLARESLKFDPKKIARGQMRSTMFGGGQRSMGETEEDRTISRKHRVRRKQRECERLRKNGRDLGTAAAELSVSIATVLSGAVRFYGDRSKSSKIPKDLHRSFSIFANLPITLQIMTDLLSIEAEIDFCPMRPFIDQ